MMRTLSLCTGYGGLDLAVEAVTGARTVAVSDLDNGANKILAHRFPDVPNLGDLKAIDWTQWAGVEVMTAGYPCQPFSHAGKREGTDDPRHIFPNIAEGIRVVGPRLVVLENVRGHLALGFDTVLGTLADIGYDARWVCVRASDVGAPHRRERMFIVATPGDSHGQGLEGWPAVQCADQQPARPNGLVPAPNASGERHGRWEDGRGLGRLDGPDESDSRERERSREVSGDRGSEAHAHTTSDPWRLGHGDRPPTERQDANWGEYGPAVARWAAVLGRPAPAPTDGGQLSPRFTEWMMGLPAGWVTDVPGLTRPQQSKALGNGVVPQQAAAALTFLLAPSSAAKAVA